MNQIMSLLKRIGVYILALGVGMFCFFPFYWIITLSFRSKSAIFKMPPDLFPQSFTLDNYIQAFHENDIGRFLLNSFYVVVISVSITIFLASLAAYALAKFDVKGKAILQKILVATQAFPIVVILVPLYFLSRFFQIYNTHVSLIIPYVAGQLSICTLLLISYFANVHQNLIEAAAIDGCDRLRIFVKIVFPLSLPGIAACAIYSFISLWQEFLLASTFLNKRELFTLTVGLSTFRGQHSTDWGGLMATSVVIALPSLVMFSLAQNYFINNMAGGIKE